jgi:glycosyltransferase involved in cell wall biosynthesis
MDINFRVAYILGGIYIGGQESQLLNLCNGLIERNHKPFVFIWNSSNENSVETISKFHEIGVDLIFLKGNLIKKVLEIRRNLTKHKIKIVHSFTFYTNFFLWLSCIGIETIAVGGLRSSFKFIINSKGSKIVGVLSGLLPIRIISNGQESLNELRCYFKKYKIKREGAVIINSVNTNYFKNQAWDDKIVNLRILGVGRLCSEKNWLLFLEIVEKLHKIHPDLEARIVGSGYLESYLNEQIKIKNLMDVVKIIPAMKDIRDHYKWCSLLLQTSISEGTPNVILEAASSGRMVVASNVGETKMLVIDNETGYLYKSNNLEEALFQFEKINSNNLFEMGINARKYAEDNFSIDSMVKSTFSVYSKFIFQQ